MEGQNYLVALSHFQRFGPRRLKLFFDFFGSWQAVWQAPAQLLSQCGIKSETVSLFLEFRNKINPDALLEQIIKKDIKLLFLEDELYPPLLREIYDPPFVLYYRGTIDEQTFALPLAVVGTRKISSYGKEVTEDFIKELVASEITIISGLALGVDCLAHETAVTAGGRTVAFLGSGVDEIYPRTNYQLAQGIMKNKGALISEYPPGTLPFKANFPRRNRLIAGSSLGTLVIEAAEKSGALITARYALEEGRDVFAVPGSVYAQSSQGPNNLLRAGAKAVTGANDIKESLGIEAAKSRILHQAHLPLAGEEMIIIELLGGETKHANEIARLAKMTINVVNSRLTIMEMKGLVKHLGGMNYVRTRQPKQ